MCGCLSVIGLVALGSIICLIIGFITDNVGMIGGSAVVFGLAMVVLGAIMSN